MDAAAWDAKYSARELTYGEPPNAALVDVVTALPRGGALDLASGQGRNALWLATRGWSVTAVDFSEVALTRAHHIASRSPSSVRKRLTYVHADVTSVLPEPEYDLILVLYLHLPHDQRRKVIRNAAAGLKPDGILMILGHHPANLTRGTGGPQEPEILYTPEQLASDVGDHAVIHRCEEHVRTTNDGIAVDSLLLAGRSGLGSGHDRE